MHLLDDAHRPEVKRTAASAILLLDDAHRPEAGTPASAILLLDDTHRPAVKRTSVILI